MLYLEVLGELAETTVEPVLARHEQLDVVQLGEVQLQQVEEVGLLRDEIRKNASSASITQHAPPWLILTTKSCSIDEINGMSVF